MPALQKLQFEKIAAEEARVACDRKGAAGRTGARQARRRGAPNSRSRPKADADAKAAEQARIAAEKAKQVAQEQAAEAEQKRVEAEKAAPDTARTETLNLAALSAGAPQTEVNKSVQAELRRVGCLSAEPTANWKHDFARSLTLFKPLCQDQVRHQAGLDRRA